MDENDIKQLLDSFPKAPNIGVEEDINLVSNDSNDINQPPMDEVDSLTASIDAKHQLNIDIAPIVNVNATNDNHDNNNNKYNNNNDDDDSNNNLASILPTPHVGNSNK